MKGLLYVLGVPVLIIAIPVILYVIIDRLINQQSTNASKNDKVGKTQSSDALASKNTQPSS